MTAAGRARSVLAWLSVMLLLASPSAARAAPPVDAAAPLAPGQFVWDDAADATGPLFILVSLSTQRIHVYREGVLIGVAAISSGAPGHGTPTGAYTILEKDRWHRSNLYSNAPMPFMQRLTWDGIAIHAGWNPGYPASHGCIRVPTGFARHLFAVTDLGASVSIIDAAAPPVRLRFDALIWLAMMEDDGMAGGAPVRLAYSADIFVE